VTANPLKFGMATQPGTQSNINTVFETNVENALDTTAKPAPATGSALRQKSAVRDGIPKDKSKPLIEAIKGAKLKVQAQYQDEQIRVSAKSKDDLQKVIHLLKGLDYELPLQFVNYR